MDISASSGASQGISLQMLRSLMGAKGAGGTGQELPPDPATTGNDAPPPAKPHGHHRHGMASSTMASLIDAQSGKSAAKPSASTLADSLLKALDSDGDGSASLDEITSALGKKSPDATTMSKAFNTLDGDANGALSAAELASGLENLFAARQGQKAYVAQQAAATSNCDKTAATTNTTVA